MFGDSKCPIASDAFMSAVAEFRALVASPIEVIDHFVDLIESLPIVSKGHAEKLNVRAKVVAEVGHAFIRADLEWAIEDDLRRFATPASRDSLRQFRDLKKRPTKRRLLNILERDKDENDLRPAESAIRFAVLELGIFGDDVPLDWIERLSDSPNRLRKVAETVCEYFAYKIDRRGRPRDTPLETYVDRLAQIYEELTGNAITSAKATDTSLGRKPGEAYGRGLDFMLAGLRLVDPSCTSYQAVAQIDRVRKARLGVAS